MACYEKKFFSKLLKKERNDFKTPQTSFILVTNKDNSKAISKVIINQIYLGR
jgi:hypothetical protein